LNGLETIRQLRQKAGQNLPAILITGDTELPTLAGFESLHVLRKPIQPEQLKDLMAGILANDGGMKWSKE
jgi:CheY-like chemotaxis protein